MTWSRPLCTVGLAACAFLAAAMAQAPDRPALPAIPTAPVMDDRPYPECRYDYRERNLAYSRAEETTSCIERIDAYYAEVLAPFPEQMATHQQAIADLQERVPGDGANYEQVETTGFLAALEAEHLASNFDGAHLSAYRDAEARYREDREFLGERFCRYAECEGFEPNAVSAERDAEDGMFQQCSGEIGDNMMVEGLLGRLLDRVRRIDTGTNITGAMISVACRLRPEEQQLANEATDAVVAQEEVGATAEWVSPTREDVSGSSTVTGLNSEPNGATCLDITDVVIINGEEARMTKTMCRAPGSSRYILQA